MLTSGAVLGHGLSAAALPLLTRIFSPESFGAFAAFTAVSTVLSSITCLRLDVAISIPKAASEARRIVGLAVGVALAMSALFLSAIALVYSTERLLDVPISENYLVVVPVATLVLGVYSACQNSLIRTKNFAQIAASRVIQSAGTAFAQVLLGLCGVGGLGMVLGYIVGPMCALVYLRRVSIAYADLRIFRFSRFGWTRVKLLLSRYRSFPAHSAPEALLNSSSLHLPILLIAFVGGSASAGHISLAIGIMYAPMALVGTAVGQLFLSSAPTALRDGRLGTLTRSIVIKLLLLGGAPIVAFGIMAPTFFPYLFGSEWQAAGEIALWMTPWFLLQFLASPLSVLLLVIGKSRLSFQLQAMGLVTRAGSIFLSDFTGLTPGQLFCISSGLFYFLYLILILAVSADSKVDANL